MNNNNISISLLTARAVDCRDLIEYSLEELYLVHNCPKTDTFLTQDLEQLLTYFIGVLRVDLQVAGVGLFKDLVAKARDASMAQELYSLL